MSKEEMYKSAIAAAQRSGNKRAEAAASGGLAGHYGAQFVDRVMPLITSRGGPHHEFDHDIVNALHFHRRALELYSAISDSDGIALTSFNMGSLYEHALEDYTTAIACYEKAVNYARDTGARQRYASRLAHVRQRGQ